MTKIIHDAGMILIGTDPITITEAGHLHAVLLDEVMSHMDAGAVDEMNRVARRCDAVRHAMWDACRWHQRAGVSK